jgi:hypothetical protein
MEQSERILGRIISIFMVFRGFFTGYFVGKFNQANKTLMKKYRIFALFGLLICSCKGQTQPIELNTTPKRVFEKSIYYSSITSDKFFASYRGADFVNRVDVAHRLSNYVADTLGKYLKMEYKLGNYKKIDFESTKIETNKYHPDSVFYTIEMPLISVSKCDAFTCIDHRGSWASRIKKTDSDLQEFITKISIHPSHKAEVKLFRTEFGLYEYWVQFRHPEIQSNCK